MIYRHVQTQPVPHLCQCKKNITNLKYLYLQLLTFHIIVKIKSHRQTEAHQFTKLHKGLKGIPSGVFIMHCY